MRMFDRDGAASRMSSKIFRIGSDLPMMFEYAYFCDSSAFSRSFSFDNRGCSSALSTVRTTSSLSTISIRIDPGSSVPRHRDGPRQRYRELRAAADDALRGDLALGGVKNPPRDGEAESRSAASALGRDERLEDPAQQVRR